MDSAKPSKAILFDMDGVLVDVSDSYRKTIQETIQFYTGKKAGTEEIQHLKEKGGYNNDWDLTEALLIGKGKLVPKTEIIKKFQELYLGVGGKAGFIENEKWLLAEEKLMSLKKKFYLGIVTGRPRTETLHVLKKFKVEGYFDIIVAMEDYPPEKAKPNPYPICLALERLRVKRAIYVGDSVDDVTSAKRANITAVGCIPPGVEANRLRAILLKAGAEKILNSVNEIEQ